MIKSIGVFLAAHDSILFIAIIILVCAIASIISAYLFWRQFCNAWEESLKSLVAELNSSGTKIAETLIEIAMISADGVRGSAIGMAKKDILDDGKSTNFFLSLPSLIEVINDNNHTIVLNGDYAAARDSIKEAIELVEKYRDLGDFNSFAKMAVEIAAAKRKLKDSARILGCKLCGLKPQDDEEST